MIWTIVTAVAASLSVIVAVAAIYYSKKANDKAETANDKAETANEIADAALAHAKSAETEAAWSAAIRSVESLLTADLQLKVFLSLFANLRIDIKELSYRLGDPEGLYAWLSANHQYGSMLCYDILRRCQGEQPTGEQRAPLSRWVAGYSQNLGAYRRGAVSVGDLNQATANIRDLLAELAKRNPNIPVVSPGDLPPGLEYIEPNNPGPG